MEVITQWEMTAFKEFMRGGQRSDAVAMVFMNGANFAAWADVASVQDVIFTVGFV